MLPPELVENAGEDYLEATLTVGHPRQGGVLAFVFEDALKFRCLTLMYTI